MGNGPLGGQMQKDGRSLSKSTYKMNTKYLNVRTKPIKLLGKNMAKQ